VFKETGVHGCHSIRRFALRQTSVFFRPLVFTGVSKETYFFTSQRFRGLSSVNYFTTHQPENFVVKKSQTLYGLDQIVGESNRFDFLYCWERHFFILLGRHFMNKETFCLGTCSGTSLLRAWRPQSTQASAGSSPYRSMPHRAPLGAVLSSGHAQQDGRPGNPLVGLAARAGGQLVAAAQSGCRGRRRTAVRPLCPRQPPRGSRRAAAHAAAPRLCRGRGPLQERPQPRASPGEAGERPAAGDLQRTPAVVLCRSPRSSVLLHAPGAREGRRGGAAPAPDVAAEMAEVDVFACMPCCYPDMAVNDRYNTCCHRMRQTLVEDLDAGEFH
jgi:hypothetical protein